MFSRTSPRATSDVAADLAGTMAGDAGAAERLVRRLRPVIEAQIRASLRRPGVHLLHPTVADLSQDVWVGLLDDDARLLRAYDPSRGASLETYVALLTRREVSDWARGQRTLKRSVAPVAPGEPRTADTPETAVIADDLARALESELLRVLPEKGQLVYRYVYRDGLDTPTVARTLQVSQQVVYNWTHTIRGIARDLLARAEA
jgi:RNA polymerase sigma factor (sigma-70 family)